MEQFKFLNIRVVLELFCFSLLLVSCTSSEYQKRETVELAKGFRNDSLFHSIFFGMTSGDYRKHCANMNRNGVFSEGPANSAVEFTLVDLPFPSTCFFTPSFFNDRIYQVSGFVQYDAWAPWNRRLHSDSLQVDIKDMIKKWYGRDDFLIIPKPNSKDYAFVFLDANRRVTILRENEAKVRIIFRDVTIKDDELPTNE